MDLRILTTLSVKDAEIHLGSDIKKGFSFHTRTSC